jgi:hypothetical protein
VFKLAPTYLVVTPVLLLTLLSAVPHHEASLKIRKHEMVFIVILKFEFFNILYFAPVLLKFKLSRKKYMLISTLYIYRNCGSGMLIPDPDFYPSQISDHEPWIRIPDVGFLTSDPGFNN